MRISLSEKLRERNVERYFATTSHRRRRISSAVLQQPRHCKQLKNIDFKLSQNYNEKENKIRFNSLHGNTTTLSLVQFVLYYYW